MKRLATVFCLVLLSACTSTQFDICEDKCDENEGLSDIFTKAEQGGCRCEDGTVFWLKKGTYQIGY